MAYSLRRVLQYAATPCRVPNKESVVGGRGVTVRSMPDGSSIAEVNYPLAEAMAQELTLEEHCAVMAAISAKLDTSGDEDLHKAFTKMFPGLSI